MRGSGAGVGLVPKKGLVEGLWTFFDYRKTKNKNYTLPFQSIDTIVTSLPFTMNHAKVKVTIRQHNDVPFLETLTRVRTSMQNT